MTVTPPPIEPAEQLLDPKAELGELKGALCRGVAADTVAVDDVDLVAIETRGAVGAHLPVGKAHRARDMSGGISLARARIDDDNRRQAGFEIDRQIPRVGVKAQLVLHQCNGFAGLGNTVFQHRGIGLRHEGLLLGNWPMLPWGLWWNNLNCSNWITRHDGSYRCIQTVTARSCHSPARARVGRCPSVTGERLSIALINPPNSQFRVLECVETRVRCWSPE